MFNIMCDNKSDPPLPSDKESRKIFLC